MTDEPSEPSDSEQDTTMRDETTPETPTENIVHFNPWRDFNDAAPQIDVFGDEPDPEQIAQFMQVVFSYCDGLIPVRSFIDKGQGIDGRPHNIWLEADQAAPEKMATFATWASREGVPPFLSIRATFGAFEVGRESSNKTRVFREISARLVAELSNPLARQEKPEGDVLERNPTGNWEK